MVGLSPRKKHWERESKRSIVYCVSSHFERECVTEEENGRLLVFLYFVLYTIHIIHKKDTCEHWRASKNKERNFQYIKCIVNKKRKFLLGEEDVVAGEGGKNKKPKWQEWTVNIENEKRKRQTSTKKRKQW